MIVLQAPLREDAKARSGSQPEELVEALANTRYEEDLFSKWHPISAVPLSELVVHGQDIRRPLGIEREFRTDRLVPIANLLKRRLGVIGRDGGRPSGIRCEATDGDWSWGRGDVVRGPLEEIIMLLAGRHIA